MGRHGRESAGRFSLFPLSERNPHDRILPRRATAAVTSAVVRAARHIIVDLERSRRIDAAGLRNAMEAAFGASDASGAWTWKTAYDACEAATRHEFPGDVLHGRALLRGRALRRGGLFGLQATDLRGILLKYPEGGEHFADLVAPVCARDFDVQAA